MKPSCWIVSFLRSEVLCIALVLSPCICTIEDDGYTELETTTRVCYLMGCSWFNYTAIQLNSTQNGAKVHAYHARRSLKGKSTTCVQSNSTKVGIPGISFVARYEWILHTREDPNKVEKVNLCLLICFSSLNPSQTSLAVPYHHTPILSILLLTTKVTESRKPKGKSARPQSAPEPVGPI